MGYTKTMAITLVEAIQAFWETKSWMQTHWLNGEQITSSLMGATVIQTPWMMVTQIKELYLIIIIVDYISFDLHNYPF